MLILKFDFNEKEFWCLKANNYVEKLMFKIDNIETNIQCCYQLIKFSIKMRFLYHETIFFICENKRTKENKKTSYIIECVMIFVFFILKKLRYIEC